MMKKFLFIIVNIILFLAYTAFNIDEISVLALSIIHIITLVLIGRRIFMKIIPNYVIYLPSTAIMILYLLELRGINEFKIDGFFGLIMGMVIWQVPILRFNNEHYKEENEEK